MVDFDEYINILKKKANPIQEKKAQKKVSICEKGIVFHGTSQDNQLNIVVFRIDGDLVKTGTRCDNLLLVGKGQICKGHFIELKGSDIDHAIQQLKSTLNNKLFKKEYFSEDRKAYIVARAFPSHKSNPIIEKARKNFRVSMKTALYTIKSNQIISL